MLWKDIQRGDIIKLYWDDQVPSDIVLVNTSLKGTCYVETKNLDGESNLKWLESPYEINKLY